MLYKWWILSAYALKKTSTNWSRKKIILAVCLSNEYRMIKLQIHYNYLIFKNLEGVYVYIYSK